MDDLLATGGIVDYVAKLIRQKGFRSINSFELLELNGKSKLNFPVKSMLYI